MDNILAQIIDVSTGKGSSTSFLIKGKEKNALIDCGMSFCAKELIHNIKSKLGAGEKLDYLLLSHSHYDHIGAVPYLKTEWPMLEVLGAEYAKNVLEKERALNIIRELSEEARSFYGILEDINYSDSLMKVDTVIREGDTIDLGGIIIKPLETPGHTRCSLAFLLNDDVIFASETTGMITETGEYHPCFVISYRDAIAAINKCRVANPTYIFSPHYGLVDSNNTQVYWDKCQEVATERRNFVLELYNRGYDENMIFEEFRNAFMDREMGFIQPGNAFELNNRAMIKAVIKEL